MEDNNVQILHADPDVKLAALVENLILSGSQIDKKHIQILSWRTNNLSGIQSDNSSVLPIILITAAFYECPHSMRMLGAYIGKYKNQIYPITFNPIGYNDLRGMIFGVQVENSDNENAFLELSKILEIKTGCTISTSDWSEARKNFKNNYNTLKNKISSYKLRKRNVSDPYYTVYEDIKDIMKALKHSGYIGFEPYPLLYHKDNNHHKRLLLDISRTSILRHKPNTLSKYHESKLANGKLPESTPSPIALITIACNLPGRELPVVPDYDQEKLQFYKYINWWDIDSHKQLVDAVKEAEPFLLS